MTGAWVPAQESRGVPWAAEVTSIMQGMPKVSRMPTGGWRGIGAVPSHSYAYPGDVPGYWSGLGQVASTTGAQAAKTTAPTSTTTQWLDALKVIGTSAVDAYTAQQRYAAYRRTGDPSLLMPSANVTPVGAPGAAPGGGLTGNTMLLVGGAAVAGLVLFMAMRGGRKR